MPIKKENRCKYPPNWKSIRQEILKEANFQCEGSPKYPECRAKQYEPHPETGSKVVLTIAHLDHIPDNVSRDNLKCWCQRCHLAYDSQHHADNAKITRDKKKYKNQRDFFEKLDNMKEEMDDGNINID